MTEPTILDAKGRPARRAAADLICPKCGAGKEKQEPSCGLGVPHTQCRCGYEWKDVVWRG